MYRFKYAKNTQYIKEINENLKTEVDKYQHINALVKRSVKNTKNHLINIGTGKDYSILDYANRIMKILNINLKING